MRSVAAVMAPLEPEVLAQVAASLVDESRSVPLPPGDHRRWVHLVATEDYDAWLIAWPSGAALGMHDHGGSSAAVRVLVGELEERHCDIDHAADVRVRRLRAGEGVRFGPEHVHALRNDGSIEVLSVHVYSPPLGQMSYFD